MKSVIRFIFFFHVIFFIIVSCAKKNPTNPASKNSKPTAYFSVIPNSGTLSTIFNFDASASSDKESASNSLKVRWDWENDGTWDTSYSTIKTSTHRYSTEGAQTITMEVKGMGGSQILLHNYLI